MKKFISILITFINFFALFILVIILNINLLTKKNNIINISNSIDYLSFVNTDSKDSDVKNTYDNLYKSLQDEGLSSNEIYNFYNSKYLKTVVGNVIYDGYYYLVNNKYEHNYSVKSLNKMVDNDSSLKNKDAIKKINYNFVNISNNIKYTIDSSNYYFISTIRFLLSDIFKIILLSIIIVSIIIEYLLNKEDFLPYIFIGSIMVSLFCLVISVLSDYFINIIFNNNFIVLFAKQYIISFSNSLLTISTIILIISIIYLIVNQKVYDKYKIHIKPRIKIKK